MDVDQSGIIDGQYGEGMTVTSAMKGLAATVRTMLDQIQAGTFSQYGGQIATLGLVSDNPDENYVQLPVETTQWGEGFELDDYLNLVAAMYTGDITVSSDITAEPAVSNCTVTYYGNIK